MSYVPATPIGKAKARLRQVIAESAIWQTWCGVSSSEAAAAQIYYSSAEVPSLLYPHLIIDTASLSRTSEDIRDGVRWPTTGANLLLYFCDQPRTASFDDQEIAGSADQMLLFEDLVDQVLAEIEEHGPEADDVPYPESYDLDMGPTRNRTDLTRNTDAEDDELEVQYLLRLIAPGTE